MKIRIKNKRKFVSCHKLSCGNRKLIVFPWVVKENAYIYETDDQDILNGLMKNQTPGFELELILEKQKPATTTKAATKPDYKNLEEDELKTLCEELKLSFNNSDNKYFLRRILNAYSQGIDACETVIIK